MHKIKIISPLCDVVKGSVDDFYEIFPHLNKEHSWENAPKHLNRLSRKILVDNFEFSNIMCQYREVQGHIGMSTASGSEGSLVQTLIKTKHLSNYKWWGIFEIQNIYHIVCVYSWLGTMVFWVNAHEACRARCC